MIQRTVRKPVVSRLESRTQLWREPRMIQRSAPLPAIIMPGVLLHRDGLKQTKVSAQLLQALVSPCQYGPNPTLLSAGVRDERIALSAALGRGI
eukprot:1522236-Rhodomonas_salina.1